MISFIAQKLEQCFFCGDEIHKGAFCHTKDTQDGSEEVWCDYCERTVPSHDDNYPQEDYYHPSDDSK